MRLFLLTRMSKQLLLLNNQTILLLTPMHDRNTITLRYFSSSTSNDKYFAVMSIYQGTALLLNGVVRAQCQYHYFLDFLQSGLIVLFKQRLCFEYLEYRYYVDTKVLSNESIVGHLRDLSKLASSALSYTILGLFGSVGDTILLLCSFCFDTTVSASTMCSLGP